MKKLLFFAVTILLVCTTITAQPPQGLKWTKEGDAYFAAEAGSIVKYTLPSLSKTVIVSCFLIDLIF